jgi:F0F1-type ATP synthase membrane subunit b/b'
VNVARRVAFAVMVLISGWSLWTAAPAAAWSKPGDHTSAARVAAESRPDPGQGHEEEPAPINWFEFGSETPPFIATIVNFGILVAGYYLLGKRPIAAALKNRRDSISKEIEEAQKMKREAEARAELYQAKLEKLEEEVHTAREALVRAGEAERDRIVADAEAKAERMRREAQFLVEQELKQIRQDLLRDTLEAAIASAEQLLKTRVTPADQERLAEDYLADLGGKPRSERALERVLPAEPGAGNSS